MVCKNCQFPLEENAGFCGRCGAAVESADCPQVPVEQPPSAPPGTPVTPELQNGEYPVQIETKPNNTLRTVVLSACVAVVVGVAAFFLCQWLFGNPSDGNGAAKGGLQGTWRVSTVLSEGLESTMGYMDELMAEMYSELDGVDVQALLDALAVDAPLTAYVQFQGNKADIILNSDEICAVTEELYANIVRYVENGGLEDIYKMQGYDGNELKDLLEESGMTEESLLAAMKLEQSQCKAQMVEMLDLIALSKDGKNYTVYSFEYTYEDGFLCVAGEDIAIPLEIRGNTAVLGDSEILPVYVRGMINRLVTIERAELPQ